MTDIDPGMEINDIFDQAEKTYVNTQLDGNRYDLDLIN